jgi:cyclopropane fatty-acyl-phospholipid synthase-like methyltransferase
MLKKIKQKKYLGLKNYYEAKFKKYGANSKGVAYKDCKGHRLRHEKILEILNFFKKKSGYSLLDLGCGYGELIKTIRKLNYEINYTGVDISELIIKKARLLFKKNSFSSLDILKDKIKNFDFVIMNGLFTVKNNLSEKNMKFFFYKMIKKVNNISKKGYAFNIMKHNRKRKDLFYLSYDELSKFLNSREFSGKYIFRKDYSLHEFMIYVFK